MSWLSRLFGSGGNEVDDPLVIVPIPPLVTLLETHEAEKGAPLTEDEVLEIRDKAVCMTMSRSRAVQLAESRGFADIDPANVWEEWVQARRLRSN